MGYYSDLLPLLKIKGSIMLQILMGWDVLMIIWAYYIPEGNLVFDCSHPWSFFIQAFVIKCCWKYCCHWALGFYFPLQEVFDNCLYCYKGYLEQAMNELYPFISDSPLSLVHLDYIPIGVNKYDYIYSSCCFIVLMPLVRDLNTLKRKWCD